MIKKEIIYFGCECILFCDGKCEKAWGLNTRPRVQLSDEDDFEWMSDGELGEAPVEPCSYEGGHAKPVTDDEKLNKWCCRECERSEMIDKSEVEDDTDFEALCRDFSVRRKNIDA